MTLAINVPTLAQLRHPWRLLILALTCLTTLANAAATQSSYLNHPALAAFIAEVTTQDGHDREALLALFATAQRKESILESIARPAERTLNWADYRRIFITEQRITEGVAFHRQHVATLRQAEQRFGVPSSIIVAILGVETLYGQRKGQHRVIDALSTLAFDYPPRAPFFRDQLREFLSLGKEANIDLYTAQGSYAGAMGYPQFIPGSYRHYAIDFDKDGRTDLLNSPVDAIGSIANYLHKHRWIADAPIATPARQRATRSDKPLTDVIIADLKPRFTVAQLADYGVIPAQDLAPDLTALVMQLEGAEGNELWLGLNNFYVITRYNHSHLYAMAVFQLSEAIRHQL